MFKSSTLLLRAQHQVLPLLCSRLLPLPMQYTSCRAAVGTRLPEITHLERERHLYLTNWQHQKPGSKRNSSGWFWWFYKLGIHCQLVLYPSKRYWLLDLLKQGTSGLNGIILFAAVVQYSRPRKQLGLGPLMQQGGTQLGEASSIVRHFGELENPHVYNSCQRETSAMPHETSGKGTCWMHGWLTTGFNSHFMFYVFYIYMCIRTHTCMHTYMHTYIALLHGIAWHYMLAFHAYMNTYVICM